MADEIWRGETLETVSAAPAMVPAPERRPDGQDAVPSSRKALVGEWCDKIRQARDVTHAGAFRRMRDATQWAAWGADRFWVKTCRYTVNLIGRHISQKTAVLYAKNPTVVVKPLQRMEGTLWDGTVESLMQAMAAAEVGDPAAMAILEEAQRIILDRKARKRFADTVRLLVQHTWDKHFKAELKAAVRRALTCGVAYIAFDLYRTTSTDPDVLAKINDTRTRIANLEAQMAKMAHDQRYLDDSSAELERLRLALQSLESEPEIIEQEGVIYDFPKSWEIIPDPACRSLRAFAGADWVARERYMTPEQVLAAYKVRLEGAYQGYISSSSKHGAPVRLFAGNQEGMTACVWEVYCRTDGTRFVVCDGHPDFLVEPSPPPVYRRGFWPWVPIVFNEQELPENELFPPSDVDLLREAQDEINQAKQGLREHRKAARPIYLAPMNAFRDEEVRQITQVDTFGIVFVQGMQPGTKSSDLLVPVEKHKIDPAVYATEGSVYDMQLIAGVQEANLGPTSGATATEVSIAEGSRSQGLSEDADSLDDTLGVLAEEVALMAIDGLGAETVRRIVGDGAVWPEMSRKELAEQIEIGVKAGSSGKPNQAAEVAKLERVAQYLLRMPNINPIWLAERYLERLDEDLNLADAISPTMPSIEAINAIQTKLATDQNVGLPVSNEPAAQGPEGADKTPRPPRFARGPQPAYDDSGALGDTVP